MENKILLVSFLTTLLTSCGNDNYKKENVSVGQNNNSTTNYPIKISNEITTTQNTPNLNNPNYILSNNSTYNVDESIRKLQQENQVLYETQMRDIEKMKEGLNDFNSPKYKELENDRRVKEIMAESDRMIEEIKKIGTYKQYERAYIPDPVILPNSPNHKSNLPTSSNDYISPYANPAKVEVSEYQKRNGTNVEAHIRTAPNDRVTDNLRY